jgi:putative salt-induced outer membrane protein YdiY
MPAVRLSRAVMIVLSMGLLFPSIAVGQEDEEEQEEPGWHNTAELSLVLTAGNAEASTVGFSNQLRHVWEDAVWRLGGGGIRTESTTAVRSAVGTSQDDFQIEEEELNEVTAENYYLRSRYDRDLSADVFWFAGIGWNRNTFAGIENRYSTNAGVGNTWFTGEGGAFRTDYSFTYTFQDNVAGGDDTFAGLRIGYEYSRKLTENTRFESVLVADENLEERSDFRTDLLNSVAVAMTETLSLKVSHQVLFDNRPSFETLSLVAPDGMPTGESVLAELEEVDTTLTVAVVADL